jgi:two-component system, OmpR family, osmolarity sensor histidine kinase EnvZ
MHLSIKPYLPKSLFGRAALILLTPVVVVQLLVSIVFIQRHYENVTDQLTSAVARDIRVLLPKLTAQNNLAKPSAETLALAQEFGINFRPMATETLPQGDSRDSYDLAGRAIIATLYNQLAQISAVDLASDRGWVVIYMDLGPQSLRFDIERGRFSASNPHQLLVLMIFAGAVMSLISFVFMRNQLTPITRMAHAAEAFGRGQFVPYTPRGATEVRAAGQAFLAMRARIERQLETRTQMLSGVSHDLRSPLTRLKLGLALLPESDDTRALLSDIADMERLLDEFLAFARGDAMEETTLADPGDLLRKVVARVQRGAGAKSARLQMGQIADAPPSMMRPEAVARALENLIGNAQRFGSVIEVSLQMLPESLRFVVEDNGPGIPADKRQRASEPFARLDEARNPNQGGGVGLGLAIAADVARSHGGALTLGDSAALGGLRAELRIAR